MALLILEALLPSSLCVCPHLAELQLSLCTQSPGGPSLGFYSASPWLTVMVVPQGAAVTGRILLCGVHLMQGPEEWQHRALWAAPSP